MSEGNWYHEKSPSENMPTIRHELLAEKIPSGNNAKLDKAVTNLIGSEISLPKSWTRTDVNRGLMSVSTFKSPSDSASLNFLDRGAPINEQSDRDFQKLLSDNQNLTRPKELAPAEIKKLSQVLGTVTVGDNQYTNDFKPPSPQAPSFHMFSAQLIPLNGKTALEVQGNFFKENGEKGTEFRGVFVPRENHSNQIQNFYLQADNGVDVAKHQKEYKAALASIKW